ncbi:MAG: C4-dicarboxylate ABC transporter permease [Bacteroidota bacterium]
MALSIFRRLKIPHVFALLLGVIFFCSLLTYVVPSGEYQRQERQIGELTRTMVLPNTFESLPKHYSLQGVLWGEAVEGQATPVGILQFLSAIPRGLEQSADIIFFIFIIGGVFGILQRTGAITAAIRSLVNRFANSGPLLTIILVLVISISGSTLGMGEEFIPLVPIFLFVSKELGYDRIYGLALVMLAADIGFAAATTNPFTVQIAQGIAEVPLGGDIGFRLIFYAACLAITLTYLLRYGARVKKDPSQSIMAGDDFSLAEFQLEEQQLRPAHLWILFVSALIFSFIIYAVQNMGWWLNEMAGGFILIGILAALIGRLSVEEATKAFTHGMTEMVVAALVVGFARGIQVVLMDGKIMDSLIFYAAQVLQSFPKVVAAEGMLVFQSLLNFFIPSGSGQAATTMPLMAPLSDVLGLDRQTAVFAFTCGDGFSNTIIPTSGVLMAMLALAKIPYDKWLRFMLPLFLQLILASAIFLAITVYWYQ